MSEADRAMRHQAEAAVAAKAKLLVVLLSFAWGFNWIATATALTETPPWSLRFTAVTVGAATLFMAAHLTGYDLRVPRGQWRHIVVAGFFNVAVFHILGAYAQLSGSTSRVVIVTYSMPIWSVLMARIALGERMNVIRLLALMLCIAGLAILVWPLISGSVPVSLLYALGCALSWGFATVYVKWAEVTIEPLVNAAWQLMVGLVLMGAGTLVFDGYPQVWSLHASSYLAIAYIGIFGVGLAHFLWWAIVARLPTITASLASLLVPVIGVSASALFLGERLTATDIIGFALIFAAAACVLLQPNVRHTEMPE